MNLSLPVERVTRATEVTASIYGAWTGNPFCRSGVTGVTLIRPAIVTRLMERYSQVVAANSATGFGDPRTSRRTGADHTAGAFFVSAASCYGGCARETFGSAGFLESRFANLRTAATLIRLATIGGSSPTLGARSMKPTLKPTKRCRIAAYKARAMAALRADSSLSVRLARYNAAMDKARTLETAGGAV